MGFTRPIFIGNLTFSRKFRDFRRMLATFFIRGWDEVCGSSKALTRLRLYKRSALSQPAFKATPGAALDWAAPMPVARLAQSCKSSGTAQSDMAQPWPRVQLLQPKHASWREIQPTTLSWHARCYVG